MALRGHLRPLLALALIASVIAAHATPLRIPPLPGGKASIRLVYQADPTQQVLGFEGPEWATAYQGLDLTQPAVVELTPTAAIATADERATCYLIAVAVAGGAAWEACIQMPDSGDVQELAALAVP